MSRLSDQLVFSSISSLQSLFFCMGDRHDAFAPSEGIKALLYSGFHDLDSGCHVLYIFFVGGTCFLDSAGTRKVFPDSEFYRQKSGFLYMGVGGGGGYILQQ